LVQGFLTGFQNFGQSFFAFLYEFLCLPDNLSAFGRHVVFAFLGFLDNQIPGLFAGLGGKQEGQDCANAEAAQEVEQLCGAIAVAHGKPPFLRDDYNTLRNATQA
jgi:hypothetical protein